jgi:RNA polymerase sigma-54 factor
MNYLLQGQLPKVGVRQNQQLLLSVAMQQAFRVLQMPVTELEDWLKNEIEQNPVLEYQDDKTEKETPSTLDFEEKEIDFEKSRFEVLESLDEGFESAIFSEGNNSSHLEKRIDHDQIIPSPISIFEHLMLQAKLALPQEELNIAEQIVGSLDHRGFLAAPLSLVFEGQPLEKAEAVLEKIQMFDPPGIAACNIKHSLLIQLRLKENGSTLAAKIIENHFEDLIHHRFSEIKKKLGCSDEELQKAVYKEIANLDLNPASRFFREPNPIVIPDIILKKEQDKWTVEVNEEILPSFRIAPLFIKAIFQSQLEFAEKSLIRRQVASGKWLQRIVYKRQKILKEISLYLIKKQGLFLSGDEKSIVPMTMQETSETLNVHPSTIARATAHKFISCPHGIFPLRSFFTQGTISLGDKEISNQTVKHLLTEFVSDENKTHPFSDDELSKKLHRMGIPVARRTIAKYRKALRIAPASHRRRYVCSEK